jgi:hypothetical protein
LPLALSIVAARGALSPNLPLRALADELRDEQIHLDGHGILAMSTGGNTGNFGLYSIRLNVPGWPY